MCKWVLVAIITGDFLTIRSVPPGRIDDPVYIDGQICYWAPEFSRV